MRTTRQLKGALERLVSGEASEDDRRAVQRELLAGNIVYAGGQQSVSVGGDAAGAIIITGNVSITGSNNVIGGGSELKMPMTDRTYEGLRENVFPKPRGIPPPFPNLIFIGREEALLEVKQRLGGANASSSPYVVVRGWPGVGKTTLVSALSRDPDISAFYCDGVLWTSLDQKPDLMTILANWGRALGRDDLLRLPTTDEAVKQIAMVLNGRKMLLIVDDVWDAGHGALFHKLHVAGCGMLVTTRLPEVADALTADGRMVYTLPVLKEPDALRLIGILAPEIVKQHPNECRELVRDLEFLPLALHVAALVLRREARLGLSVGKLLADIRSGSEVIRAKAPPDRVEGHTIPTVQALLQKSTDVLSPAARQCFAFLGPFAPKPATFDLKALRFMWSLDDPLPIVRELADHGLLEPVGSGRFQMHALLVAHARSLAGGA